MEEWTLGKLQCSINIMYTLMKFSTIMHTSSLFKSHSSSQRWTYALRRDDILIRKLSKSYDRQPLLPGSIAYIGNSKASLNLLSQLSIKLAPVIFWWNVYWRCLPQRRRSFQTGHRSLCRHEHEEEAHLGTWKWSSPRTAPLSLVCTPGEYTVHRNTGQTH